MLDILIVWLRFLTHSKQIELKRVKEILFQVCLQIDQFDLHFKTVEQYINEKSNEPNIAVFQ